MELAHSLLLNEEALQRISENKRPVFVFEWLRFLDKVLVAAQKSDIKESQQKLIAQLTAQISQNPGPPTRKLLSRCLATIFSVGDTFSLFNTINLCNDIIKSKDDSPSYLPTKLAAVACIGGMYEKLGRMVGRSYEETISLLIKGLRNAESQGRYEIMTTMQKVIAGLGSAGSNCYKDVYKAARNCVTDRAMTVRSAAAQCLDELVSEAPFMYLNELETVTSYCFRALDGSNYDVRCDVSKLLGHLLASGINPPKHALASAGPKAKVLKLEEALALLSSGFLRGGGGGFLKGASATAGEMIKGAGSINREIRVGATHAYVEFGKSMGSAWLERNLAAILDHLLGLVANPKTAQTHVDAVYARKCVQFMLRSFIGGMLGEKAQIAAAKELCQIIVTQMAIMDAAEEGDKTSIDVHLSQHVLVCALHELGALVSGLGTSASPLVSEPASGILEPVVSVLVHTSSAARLSAAWCLRAIAVALPSQMTILLDRCLTRMQHLKASPEAVSGYSFALTALLGGVRETSLGIPHLRGKHIFNVAEDLLRTATQNSRLSLQRTQSGWLLLGAIMTLGPSVVKQHLPRMLLLWRNAFPRSNKELEAEKSRGDAFTWQVMLEGRSGALGAMHSFVLHCSELVTEDVTRRLLPPLECALTMTAHLPVIVKVHGAHLKAPAAMVRLRLYDVLSLLPPATYEGSFSALLRELVAEFTLTDNPANTTTSRLRALCHHDDSVILGSWLQETDHKPIEDQLEPLHRRDYEHLQPNSASGSGALEHDAASLYLKAPANESVPGPLPLGVSVIDSSVTLFGLVFPRVAHKHRLQMLQHFADCIKSSKSARQEAVQINIFTAVLCGLKALSDTKTGVGNIDVRKAAINLVLGALGSTNPILRCAGGEALGRIAQVVGENRFIAEMAQYSFDKLKSARDVVTRTGHSLALGCLHRYVGGMGSGQHLSTSISILLALAQDSTSPVVQVWALHALALIADSGGPLFRGYVEPSLSLVLQLLLSVPPSHVDVHQCLGKCLAALITSIGPELQGNSGSVATARLSCLVCCAVMQDHSDSLVQAEAISCLQQLHLFAPRHVNLSTLVPNLCENLPSPHLLLRRAAVSCLRQLSTREAREVSEHVATLVSEGVREAGERLGLGDTGLEGALFGMLDTENDRKMVSDVQDTLISMLQALAAENLSRWLQLIKDVLQASTESSSQGFPGTGPDASAAEGKGDEDDEGGGLAGPQPNPAVAVGVGGGAAVVQVAPRWPTRVFAIQCLLKVIAACEGEETHFDLSLAKQLQQRGKGDYLVLHLSELVRMAFIAATSDSDQLRLAGLDALDKVISKYARVPEPEFPGHVILEQYQAQVGAALRPAFTPDTSPDVTAAACEVCSSWIGSGVARDLNDLRRVHQLLVSSLAKLKDGAGGSSDGTPLYSESASTMEKLAVLRAWAEVYIVAMNKDKARREKPAPPQRAGRGFEEEEEEGEEAGGESLLSLVQPEMKTLSAKWLAALRDQAMLTLPEEILGQLPPRQGGTFYTNDTRDAARPYYKKAWPSILYATALWLTEEGFTTVDKQDDLPANMKSDQNDVNRFHLLFGICMEAMCSPTSVQPLETVVACLRSLTALLQDPWPRTQLASTRPLCIELLNVLHRLLLTRDSDECLSLLMGLVRQLIRALHEHMQRERDNHIGLPLDSEDKPANADRQQDNDLPSFPVIGEGSEDGHIVPGKSVVFAALEVCLCVLVRHLPSLNPAIPQTGFAQRTSWMSAHVHELLSNAMQVMSQLPGLCSPQGSVSILPTLLFLTSGLVRELAPRDVSHVPPPVGAALQTIKALCAHALAREPAVKDAWGTHLRSALATVLHYANTDPVEGGGGGGIEPSTLMLCVSVFLVSSPPEVMAVGSLIDQCTAVFQKAWRSPHPRVRVTCVQSCTSLFSLQERTLATPFIHAVAPTVIDYLLQRPSPPDDDTEEKAEDDGDVRVEKEALPAPYEDAAEVAVWGEAVRMLETLVALAAEQNRSALLELLVPALVSRLQDQPPDTSIPAHQLPHHRALHECALANLTALGAQYPALLRAIMAAQPALRARLEAAVKAQAQGKTGSGHEATGAHRKAGGGGGSQASDSGQPQKPSITLKMDFSNFKS